MTTVHSPFTIRPATAADRDDLYEVCLLTGDAGDDATRYYRDPRIVGHVYVGPYLALQPDLAFVVDDGARACGYVLGALDTTAFEQECEKHWWPTLQAQYPLAARTGDRSTWDDGLIRAIHRPPSAPQQLLEGYPSHLHIDLLPQTWGQGLGRTLIELLCERLTALDSVGVHLVVGARNTRAQAFYDRVGFTVISAQGDGITMARALA